MYHLGNASTYLIIMSLKNRKRNLHYQEVCIIVVLKMDKMDKIRKPGSFWYMEDIIRNNVTAKIIHNISGSDQEERKSLSIHCCVAIITSGLPWVDKKSPTSYSWQTVLFHCNKTKQKLKSLCG